MTKKSADPVVTLSMLRQALAEFAVTFKEELKTEVVNGMTEVIRDLIASIDERSNKVEKRVDNHDQRFKATKSDLDVHKNQINRLETWRQQIAITSST